MKAVEQAIKEHRYEIDALKTSHGELITALKETTKTMQDLATKFAVSAQKHDHSHSDIVQLQADVRLHDQKISAMYPTVESLRGMVWKIISSMILAVGASSAIVASLLKMG